jgi:phage FluMu protein Com
VPIKTVRCSKCGSTIPIFTEDRPLQITCPGCKFSGTLKK